MYIYRTRAKMDEAQEEAERAENLMLHEDEIASRPARTWYVYVFMYLHIFMNLFITYISI